MNFLLITSLQIAIQSKFVFLPDNMTVTCMFEVFISGQHVAGEVKEKEMARNKYKKVINGGHVPYLMD